MNKLFLGAAGACALAGIPALPASAALPERAYGVGASANYNHPSGQSWDEECKGEGTFNPCIVMNMPVLSGPGTSASGNLQNSFLYPTGSEPGGIEEFILLNTSASASVDLATGDMKLAIDAPNGGNASVRLADIIYLDPATFAGDMVTLMFRVAIEGTWSDGGVGYLFQAQSASDVLVANVSYNGQVPGLHDIASPPQITYATQVGNWSTFGPNIFEGQLTVSAADPYLYIDNALSVGGRFADFSNTATLEMILPTGVTYTSASGVFLTQNDSAVPEPSTWAMLIVGFAAVGWSMRRRRRPAPALATDA